MDVPRIDLSFNGISSDELENIPVKTDPRQSERAALLHKAAEEIFSLLGDGRIFMEPHLADPEDPESDLIATFETIGRTGILRIGMNGDISINNREMMKEISRKREGIDSVIQDIVLR